MDRTALSAAAFIAFLPFIAARFYWKNQSEQGNADFCTIAGFSFLLISGSLRKRGK